MKTFALAALMLAATAAPVFAGGTHKGGHYTFGEPGKASEVTRTVQVTAVDQDGMKFEHEPLTIKKGETIRFVVTNKGLGDHEFSLGDAASQRAHARMMEKMPDMKHENDPSAVTLAPGETKEIIWKFSKAVQGDVIFACQLPGHYEAGMLSKVKFKKS